MDPDGARGRDVESEAEMMENAEPLPCDGAEPQPLYDPNEQQQYYYDPTDGNYYYYAPQRAVESDRVDNVSETLVASEKRVTMRELESWQPEQHNWFSDVVLSIFVSLGFKLYLCLMFYCAFVLQVLLSLHWTLQVLYRFYAPQRDVEPSAWSPVCFFVVFLLLSFVVVTALATTLDMLQGIWKVRRDHSCFLGASTCCGKAPPVWLYFFIILLTACFPFLWAIIETSLLKGSFTYFLCVYAYIAVVTSGCLIVVCYAWFYFLGIRKKIAAARLYKDRDDFESWERASRYSFDKDIKKRWYHASTLLEEYGLDERTLRWNVLSFTIGFVPLFAVYTAQAFSTNVDYPGMTWGVICTVALCCVYFLAWVTVFRRRSHWSVYISMFLIVMLLVFGFIAAIASRQPDVLGLIIVLFILSQFMLARKREHALTRVEQRTAFQINAADEPQEPAPRRRFESYLCCCPDVLRSCFRCLGVGRIINYRHPDLVCLEERYNRENVCLRTDQRLLMYWWVFVMAVVASLVSIGNQMSYKYPREIAAATGLPIKGGNQELFLCKMTYNANGSAPLGLYDLSLLSALSYTVGEAGEKDFATWFSFFPNFVRVHPRNLPPNYKYAMDGVKVPFSHYVDLGSDYHVVTLNSNYRGLSFMRDIDDWGVSITLQLATIFSPLVGMWPEGYQRAFVQRAAFFQSWFPGINVLGNVSQLLLQLINDGKKERTLLVGDGFNGGYAKLLSETYGVQYIALNAPGVGRRVTLGTEGTQVLPSRSILSRVGSEEDSTHTIYIPCDPLYSLLRCSKIETTANTIRELCGDVHGRTVVMGRRKRRRAA